MMASTIWVMTTEPPAYVYARQPVIARTCVGSRKANGQPPGPREGREGGLGTSYLPAVQDEFVDLGAEAIDLVDEC